MRKFLLVFFFLFSFLGLLFAPKAFAQDFNFERAYQDYLHTFNQYQAAHKEYVAAKSAYLTYETLTAKNEVVEKTLTMLRLRDEVVRTYLVALRTRMAEAVGISNYEESVVYLKLDTEVGWYVEHKEALSSAGTLEDLVKSSSKAEGQYGKTEVLAYQALGTILSGKEKDFRDQLKEQINQINERIAVIRQNGDKETAIMERWLLEAENKLTRSQEKEFEALQEIADIKSGNKNKLNLYSQARLLLRESNQYLKEASSYLKEIIREVKTAD